MSLGDGQYAAYTFGQIADWLRARTMEWLNAFPLLTNPTITLISDGGYRAVRWYHESESGIVDTKCHLLCLADGEKIPARYAALDAHWNGVTNVRMDVMGLEAAPWATQISRWQLFVCDTKRAIIQAWTYGQVGATFADDILQGSTYGNALAGSVVLSDSEIMMMFDQLKAYNQSAIPGFNGDATIIPPYLTPAASTAVSLYLGGLAEGLHEIASKNALVAINHGAAIFNATGLEITEDP